MLTTKNICELLSPETLRLGLVGIIHGAAGVGKTTTMLNFLDSVGDTMGNGRFITTEESEESVERTRCRTNISEDVKISALSTETDLFKVLHNEPEKVIVLDSINMVELTESKNLNALWTKLVRFARDNDKHILVVNQRTVANTPKGGTHGTHIVDYVISVDRSIIEDSKIIFKVMKNRMGVKKNHLLQIGSTGIDLIKQINYDDKDLKKSYQECLKKLKKYFSQNYGICKVKKLSRITNESVDICIVALKQLIDDDMVVECRGGYKTTQKRNTMETAFSVYKLLKKL